MSGAIFDLSKDLAPEPLTVDVCVIGSGPGGATAAWELAKAGREVLVLEEGPDRTGVALTQRDGEMYDQLYVDRGGRTTVDRSISVLQGRALGGGSVINMSDVAHVTDAVMRHWQKKHGLSDFGPEQLAPFRTLADQDLSANVPTEEQLNRNNRLLRDAAAALGWKHESMAHNRVGCAGLGACLLGCPLNAKRNARFVAIPGALAAGARCFVRARVLRIEGGGSDLKTLRCVRLDPRGYHEREPFEVKAKVVVLAANAVGSAALLLRSGLGNAHVGSALSLQPQLPVMAIFADEVRLFRGVPQVTAVTEFEELEHPEHGWWGFRIETAAATPGLAGSLMPLLGAPGRALMARYPNTAAVLVLFPDAPQGRVTLHSDGHPLVHYALDDEQRGRVRRGARAAAEAFLAAGAQEVIVPSAAPLRLRSRAELDQVDRMDFASATLPFVSAHQQGTVRFAPSERDGGAAPDGQVYGTRGVYVFDSSGFPSSASSHTMAPIITVSRYLARQLAAQKA